jgi:hypothetical protein
MLILCCLLLCPFSTAGHSSCSEVAMGAACGGARRASAGNCLVCVSQHKSSFGACDGSAVDNFCSSSQPGPEPNPGPEPAGEDPMVVPPESAWTTCAQQNDICACDGIARFGYRGWWSPVLHVSPSIKCTYGNFGVGSNIGMSKTCQCIPDSMTPPPVACPASFPYPTSAKGMDELCYNNAPAAVVGAGHCGDWCTLDPEVGTGCGDPHTVAGLRCPSNPPPPPSPCSPPVPCLEAGDNTTLHYTLLNHIEQLCAPQDPKQNACTGNGCAPQDIKTDVHTVFTGARCGGKDSKAIQWQAMHTIDPRLGMRPSVCSWTEAMGSPYTGYCGSCPSALRLPTQIC